MAKLIKKIICCLIPFKTVRKFIRSYSFFSTITFIQDSLYKKFDNYWSFPVCLLTNKLDDNLRAIFEYVKDNESIKKIILTRNKEINLTGKNVVIVPLKSIIGLKYLIKSKVIFVKHDFYANVGYNLNIKNRLVINLWHAVTLKKIGVASAVSKSQKEYFIKCHKKQTHSICSSLIDKMAMSSAMYPLTYNDIWLSGLPRHDFILMSEKLLPKDLYDDLKQIENLKQGKKLVFYAPTFRDNQEDAYFKFSAQQILDLKKLLEKHNAILGIREHMADSARTFTKQLQSLSPINLNKFSTVEIIYRCADVLITDYSSTFVDFMLTNRAIVNFSYDYEHYLNKERGFFYEVEDVFPGPINKSFDEMLENLNNVLSNKSNKQHYMRCKKTLLKYNDHNNTKRLLDYLNQELKSYQDNNI